MDGGDVTEPVVYVLCADSRELRRFVTRMSSGSRIYYCTTLQTFLSAIDHPDAEVAWDRDVAPHLPSDPGVLRLFVSSQHRWTMHAGSSESRFHDDAVWHCDPLPHWKVSRWLRVR